MRLFSVFIVALLVCGSAQASGLGGHILGGVTIGDGMRDPRTDNPGFNVGAGIDYGFSDNFVLRGTGVYTYFPFFSSEESSVPGESATDGSTTLVEVELVLRLSPRGTTPPGAPILYFLLGTGPGIAMYDPALPGGDEQVEYTWGMAGIGFETVLSGRKRVWFEFVAKATSEDVGSYYPIRVGFRF